MANREDSRSSGRSRRRAGQELPDELQDRPEQNAGYDAAVRGESTASRRETVDPARVEPIGEEQALSPVPEDEPDLTGPEAVDERAERSAIAEVRRRERQGR